MGKEKKKKLLPIQGHLWDSHYLRSQMQAKPIKEFIQVLYTTSLFCGVKEKPFKIRTKKKTQIPKFCKGKDNDSRTHSSCTESVFPTIKELFLAIP